MYIGPWQEYRLAQLQGDAVQRLRREWETQLRAELPEGDDARIRELMQPLVAKLPALLLSATSTAASKRREGVGTRDKPRRPATVGTSSRSELADDHGRTQHGHKKATKNSSNQETHDADADATAATGVGPKPPVPRAPTRKKTKKPNSAPLTAIEQVQRRKKMFATWIKKASSSTDSGDDLPETANSDRSPSPQMDGTAGANASSQCVRLPPLSSSQAIVPRELPQSAGGGSHTQLPPISSPARGWDFVYDSMASGALASSAQSAPSDPAETSNCDDLDESFDEEEVNNFLNWTDTLLCPADLDDCGDFNE